MNGFHRMIFWVRPKRRKSNRNKIRNNLNDYSITNKSKKIVFKIRNKNLNGFFTFLLEFVKEKNYL